MDQATQYDSREAQAKAEVGVTRISRAAAICALIIFLATIFAVPVIDQLAGGWRVWRQLRAGGEMRQRLHGIETALEDGSVTARVMRPGVERILALGGASGVENVYVGRDGWLFFEPDVRHATGARQAVTRGRESAPRQHDAVAAIVDFKRQLATRGIALLVVPTPVNPTVQRSEERRVGKEGR